MHREAYLATANLHLNVMVPQYNRETEDIIEPYVYEFTGMLLFANLLAVANNLVQPRIKEVSAQSTGWE